MTTIHAAMAAVMAEVSAVAKSDRNTQQNFNFRGIDAVVNAVGPALRKHGVLMIPEAETPTIDHYQSRGGAQMTHVLLPVTFRFYGPDGDSVPCRVIGEASDAGDKVMSKAHAVAWRVALLECFAIPTDDPDPDTESHERALLTESDPWAAIGWADQAEHDAAVADVIEEAKGLPEAQRAEVKEFLRINNWGKPYRREWVDQWMKKVDDITPEVSGAGGADVPTGGDGVPANDGAGIEGPASEFCDACKAGDCQHCVDEVGTDDDEPSDQCQCPHDDGRPFT